MGIYWSLYVVIIYRSLYLVTSHTGSVICHVTLSQHCLVTHTSSRVHVLETMTLMMTLLDIQGCHVWTDGNLVNVNCDISPEYIKCIFFISKVLVTSTNYTITDRYGRSRGEYFVRIIVTCRCLILDCGCCPDKWINVFIFYLFKLGF